MRNIDNATRRRSLWLAGVLPLLLALGSLNARADKTALQDFKAGSMATIEQRYASQPFVVALWSVTCPPCLHELKMLGQWRQENPDAPLVLITTDADLDRQQLTALLDDANLAGADNWVYANSHVERLRFEVDPGWHGELPRSYFYSADGERRGISGALKRAMLDEWLARED